MSRIEAIFTATIITIAFLTMLTIGGEIYAPLKTWLASTFYHHWIGKGVVSLVLFTIISFLPISIPIKKQERFLKPVIWLSVAALFAYFTWHALST